MNNMRYTPENITKLESNQIFVYGANTNFYHGAGAAKQALKFGARIGEGPFVGNTYGIPTKGKYLNILSLAEIKLEIEIFLNYVKMYPEKEWLLTKIGTGLSRYKIEDIAQLFIDFMPLPSNLVVPKEFYDFWVECGVEKIY